MDYIITWESLTSQRATQNFSDYQPQAYHNWEQLLKKQL